MNERAFPKNDQIDYRNDQEGMTLRDYFAASALNAFVQNGP